MTVKNDFGSAMTLPGFLQYTEPELKAVTGGDRFYVFQGDRLIGRPTRPELLRWFAALPGRRHSRDGVPWEVSLPDTVKAALADHGLMGAPGEPRAFLRGTLRPVLKELTAGAFTLTTAGGNRAFHKVTPFYVAAPTHNTRGGDPEVGWALYALTKAVRGDGRPAALSHWAQGYRQAPAQAVWNHAVGKRLLERNVLVLPGGKSAAAVGYRARSHGAARIRAAGAGNSGARAKKAAAKASRPPKRVIDWKQAVSGFAYTVTRAATDAVKGLAVRATRAVRRRLAARAVRAAFRFHVRSGAARFSEASVRATAHALATPHVGVKTLDRAFDRVAADPDRLGVRVAKEYQTGNRMFAPTAGVGLEQAVGRKLKAAEGTLSAGGTNAAVVKALTGRGLTTAQYVAATRIAGPGRVVFTDPHQGPALAHAAAAFRHHKKDVYVLGDKALASAVGAPNFSVSGFLDSTTRTGHLRSLWLGLRTEPWFTGSPLRTAELIRAARPRVRLERNSMVVVSPRGLDDLRAVERLLKLCERRDCKLVFAGPHAGQYRALARGRHL